VICVTGGESRAEKLAARLAAHQHFPLQEVRLDLLDRVDEHVLPLLRSPRLIATCRAVSEGGRFRGSETERLAVLRRALEQSPGFLDLEARTPAPLKDELLLRRGSTRIILSCHAALSELEREPAAEALADPRADGLKLAVAVEDGAELRALRRLLPQEERPVIRIGMGAPGLLSRALPARFGSPWTYVVPDGENAVAPGQLTVSQAAAWRVPEADTLAPLVLLGGPQVLQSPGPRVYNGLFAARRLPFLYLPVISNQPSETLKLLEELGCRGASVTMPLKEQILPLLDEIDPPAQELHAVNTVLLEGGRRVGFNTDHQAIMALVGQCGGRSLLLGAGGVARAALAALQSHGYSVTISSRSDSRAEGLATEAGASWVPWAKRYGVPFELLVNGTPCGGDGVSDPIPDHSSWAHRTVLDLTIGGPRGRTPLVDRVSAGGGRAISGLQMWLEQGAKQMTILLGQPVRAEELEEHLDG